MQRLSGLDASFLYLETPAQLLHVCGVIILDPETVPERLLVHEVQGRARAPDRRRADVPPQAQAGAARDRPPGVGGRRGLRHRPARAPDGAARARRRARAGRPVRPPRRHPAGPVPPAVGVRRHRGLSQRVGRRAHRGVHQDAPLHRRRCLRRQRDLVHVLARGRRAAARDAARAATRRGRPATLELLARGVATNLYKPVAAGQGGRARPSRAWPARSGAPARVRRCRRR